MAALTLAVAAGAEQVTFPGRPGLIVASYYGRGVPGLILISPNGKGRRRVPGSRRDADAAFSPDGRMLAFTRTRVRIDRQGQSLVSSVWVMRLDGNGVRRIIDDASAPAWSPDGQTIVFERDACRTETCHLRVSNSYEIYVTTLSGRVRRLTYNGDFDGDPSFSPDGSEIAFVAGDGLYVMNGDGTGRRRLTKEGYGDPSWSPDGASIAFSGPTLDISVIGRDGRGLRRLTDNEGPDWGPVFSPDGRRIAFQSNALCARRMSCTGETPMAIWVMNANGSGKHRLTNRTGYALTDWQRIPGTG